MQHYGEKWRIFWPHARCANALEHWREPALNRGRQNLPAQHYSVFSGRLRSLISAKTIGFFKIAIRGVQHNDYSVEFVFVRGRVDSVFPNQISAPYFDCVFLNQNAGWRGRPDIKGIMFGYFREKEGEVFGKRKGQFLGFWDCS